jgi:excinuclease ABC subunit C
MTASALDAVRGLGQARRKALVAHFGSVAKLRQASIAEITEVPGIGATTAAAVLEALGAAHTSDTEPNPAGFDAADDPVDNDVQQAL